MHLWRVTPFGASRQAAQLHLHHAHAMLAITHHRYGGPEVLNVTELPVPAPGPEQVLVEVRAASINAADYRLMRADPFLARLENGLFGPRKWPGLGSDFAGVVVEVGADVEGFAVGQSVFGDAFTDGRGAMAEYVCVGAESLAPIPAGVAFEEAAAVPLAGITALQALRDVARVKAGERVLVVGAGGGVGGFTVQLAAAMGATVSAQCGPRSLELARRNGAAEVIDYTRATFATRREAWDAIIAVNGAHSMLAYRRALAPGGRLAVVGGANRQIFAGLLLAPLVFALGDKSGRTLDVDDARRAADLAELAEALGSGALRPNIDSVWALTDAAAAMRHVERGHVQGKVVLTPPRAAQSEAATSERISIDRTRSA